MNEKTEGRWALAGILIILAAVGLSLGCATVGDILEHRPLCVEQGTDSTKWCGCWTNSGRTGGEWVKLPECTGPAPDCRKGTLVCASGAVCNQADGACYPAPAEPTPSPSATPTPSPSTPPTPPPCVDTPPVCTTTSEVEKEGSGTPPCVTCRGFREYMESHGADPANGISAYWDKSQMANGFYINYIDGDRSKPSYYNPRTCDRVELDGRIVWAFESGWAGRPCGKTETTTCTPGIKCDDPPPPPPLPPVGGVSCTPLSHIGVALHNTVNAPNGPRKIAWRFSATPKSVKPYCPERRNECEQQGYQGDPVRDYENVIWRFDERFRCQAPTPPIWSQQEPHTGDRWKPTDVNSENPWLANLKPAVAGKHVVRVCVPDGKGGQTNNCRTTTAVAP